MRISTYTCCWRSAPRRPQRLPLPRLSLTVDRGGRVRRLRSPGRRILGRRTPPLESSPKAAAPIIQSLQLTRRRNARSKPPRHRGWRHRRLSPSTPRRDRFCWQHPPLMHGAMYMRKWCRPSLSQLFLHHTPATPLPQCQPYAPLPTNITGCPPSRSCDNSLERIKRSSTRYRRTSPTVSLSPCFPHRPQFHTTILRQ